MIELKDIQTAIVDVLKKNNYTVTAKRNAGLCKADIFVDVLPFPPACKQRYL